MTSPGAAHGHSRERFLLALAEAFLAGEKCFPSLPPHDISYRKSVLRVLESAGFVSLFEKDGIVEVHPVDVKSNSFAIDGGLVNVTDFFLILFPFLAKRSFRTVLEVSGVTHGDGLSVSSLSRTFLPWLESKGIYTSSSLKKIGFQGDGEGRVEFRIYPVESHGTSYDDGTSDLSITVLATPALVGKGKELYQNLSSEFNKGFIRMLEVHGTGGPGLYCAASKRTTGGVSDMDILHEGIRVEELVKDFVQLKEEEGRRFCPWELIVGKVMKS